MENEVQPITPPIQTLPQTPTPVPTPPSTNWAKIILLSVLGLIVVAGAVLIGIQIGKNQTPSQQLIVAQPTTPATQTAVNSTILPTTPTTTTDETASWKIYKVLGLGIELKLPRYLSPLDYPNGNETKGEKGKQFCIEYTKVDIVSFLIGNVLAGGGACLPQYFGLGTTSVDYEAGRGGGFGDLQGYTYENGKYFAKMVLGKRFEIPTELAKEITNPNGVKILRIIGKNSQSSAEMPYLPIAGTPGDGRVGALINLDNVTYPGVSVEMKLDGKLNTELFDQILSTFKFTN